MPNLKKQIAQCKHPNSRKTMALSKLIKRSSAKDKIKMGQAIKQNLIGEKVMWFRDNLPEEADVCTNEQALEIIKRYLARFDDELEQITIKHSIGDRKNRQHANREDIIKLTKKRELEEFNTCGIEMPDILEKKNTGVLKKWNGELRFLQNIKMRRIGIKHLQPKVENSNSKSHQQKKKENVKSNNEEHMDVN